MPKLVCHGGAVAHRNDHDIALPAFALLQPIVQPANHRYWWYQQQRSFALHATLSIGNEHVNLAMPLMALSVATHHMPSLHVKLHSK
jgi:hypothetical protein